MRPARASWLLGLALVGCSPAGEPAGVADEEAGSDAVSEEHAAYDGAIGRQITADLTDDPHWQNCRYACYPPDAALSRTNIPWLCHPDAAIACDDPSCSVGDTCLGFNGTGVVLPCDTELPDTGPRTVPSYCP